VPPRAQSRIVVAYVFTGSSPRRRRLPSCRWAAVPGPGEPASADQPSSRGGCRPRLGVRAFGAAPPHCRPLIMRMGDPVGGVVAVLENWIGHGLPPHGARQTLDLVSVDSFAAGRRSRNPERLCVEHLPHGGGAAGPESLRTKVGPARRSSIVRGRRGRQLGRAELGVRPDVIKLGPAFGKILPLAGLLNFSDLARLRSIVERRPGWNGSRGSSPFTSKEARPSTRSVVVARSGSALATRAPTTS
jgi:hypothetical protein